MKKLTINRNNEVLLESGDNCLIAGKLLDLAIKFADKDSFDYKQIAEISYLLNEGACDSAIVAYSDKDIMLTVRHFRNKKPMVLEIIKDSVMLRDFGDSEDLFILDLEEGTFDKVLGRAKEVTQKLNELADILNK